MVLEQQVIEIVSEQLGIDKSKIDRSKKFVDDLDADSLDLTELIMTVEDRFNCEISESEAEKIKTVGDFIDYIESRKEE